MMTRKETELIVTPTAPEAPKAAPVSPNMEDEKAIESVDQICEDMKAAEAMFQNLMLEDGAEMLDQSFDIDSDNSAGNIGSLYRKQIKSLEADRLDEKLAKESEINTLKLALEDTQMAIQLQEEERQRLHDEGDSDEFKIPRTENLLVSGKETQILTVDFDSKKGPLGIKIKRFGSKYVAVDVMAGGQASKYVGVSRGLVIYQVYTWSSEQEAKNLVAEDEHQLVQFIQESFLKKLNVSFRFLIPPTGVNLEQCPQHVCIGGRYNSSPSQQVAYVQATPQPAAYYAQNGSYNSFGGSRYGRRSGIYNNRRYF